ncbi:MAG: hypothetical protein R8M45_03805 [Ghiorsea sp.]
MSSLSNADKDILGRAVKELNGSMTRVAAERDLQKEILAKVKDTTLIDPKQVKSIAKMYYDQSKAEKETEFDDVICLYESVLGSPE